MYTQAGRLSPDDTAREMKKQREMASPTKEDGKAQPQKRASSTVTEEDKQDGDEEATDEQEE